MTVPHQDLLVIDLLKSGGADTGEVETLQPRASAPEPPPISAGKTDSAAADPAPDSATPAAPDAADVPVTRVLKTLQQYRKKQSKRHR